MQLQVADQLPRPTNGPERLAAIGKWLSFADLEPCIVGMSWCYRLWSQSCRCDAAGMAASDIEVDLD